MAWERGYGQTLTTVISVYLHVYDALTLIIGTIGCADGASPVVCDFYS